MTQLHESPCCFREVAGATAPNRHAVQVEEVLKFLGIIVGSSVGVAIINAAAAGRTGRKNREATAALQTKKEEHEARLQGQAEDHASRLRRELAHDEAKKTFLPVAEALALFFTKEAYDLHWEEVGIFVFPSTERPILDNQAKVVDAARSIMWGHPTVSVRAKAKTIYDNLVAYWFDTDRAQGRHWNQERDLSQAEANGLADDAEELIRLIQAQSDQVE